MFFFSNLPLLGTGHGCFQGPSLVPNNHALKNFWCAWSTFKKPFCQRVVSGFWDRDQSSFACQTFHLRSMCQNFPETTNFALRPKVFSIHFPGVSYLTFSYQVIELSKTKLETSKFYMLHVDCLFTITDVIGVSKWRKLWSCPFLRVKFWVKGQQLAAFRQAAWHLLLVLFVCAFFLGQSLGAMTFYPIRFCQTQRLCM